MKYKLQLPDKLLKIVPPRFNKTLTLQWLKAHRRSFLIGLGVFLAILLLIIDVLRLLSLTPLSLSSLERGRQAYYAGQYTKATTELRQALREQPQSADVRYWLSQSLISLHQWYPANTYLSELLRANPNHAHLYYLLGVTQLGQGNPDAAQASWNLVINRTDQLAAQVKPRTQLALGKLRYQQGQYGQAMQLVYAALGRYDNLEAIEQQQALYLYGILLARDLRFDEAIKTLQQVLTVNLPGSAWENAPLNRTFEVLKDKTRLILNQLSSANAEKLDGAKRARLAYALIVAEEYSAAEEQLVEVLKAAPKYADARAYLATVYWRTGRSERALKTFNDAVEVAPTSKLARQLFAEFLIDRMTGEKSQQDSDHAYRLLQSLISEQPSDPILQMALARYYFVERDYKKAQIAYDQAVWLNKTKPVAGLNPTAALSRYYSDIVFDPCGKGVTYGLEATREASGDVESWYAAGLAYSKCNRSELAVPMLEKASQLKPYDTEVLYRLAVSYRAIGRIPEADRLLELLGNLDPDTTYYRR